MHASNAILISTPNSSSLHSTAVRINDISSLSVSTTKDKETPMGSPNILDDKQGFAKYMQKKLLEMCDDKRYLTLNSAKLLPNLCNNKQHLAYCH